MAKNDEINASIADLKRALDERHQRLQEERKQEDKAGRIFSAFFNVLKTPDGRKVFKHIFELVPIDTCSYSSDALLMAFCEGKRALGVELSNYIKNNFGIDTLTAIEKQEI